jgi:hypothetical protein
VSVKLAIQRMVARARIEHGVKLRDFDLVLATDIFDELRAELVDSAQLQPDEGAAAITINTANGHTTVLRRAAVLPAGEPA